MYLTEMNSILNSFQDQPNSVIRNLTKSVLAMIGDLDLLYAKQVKIE
jgi:hypothetical protein